MKLQNKVIVVTGGGNGIGRELVFRLLSAGARVAAVDINKAGLEETRRLAGVDETRLSLHVTDITDRALINGLPGKVLEKHGEMDGLINCAGIIQPFQKATKISDKSIETIMNINFYGPLFLIKAFEPYLLERKEAYIVNISSMGGLVPILGQSIYGASKAAIKLLSENLRYEYAKTNIHVSVVFPGGVNSNIMDNSGVKKNPIVEKLQKILRLTTPRKAADTIVKGMLANRYRIFIGIDVKILNFWYKISPQIAPRAVFAAMRKIFPEWA